MKIYKRIAITFDNDEVLKDEDIDILKFINDAFKIIETDGCITSRIIVSEEVWKVFHKKCGINFLVETHDGNYIWCAEVEILPNCPKIVFLSGDYTIDADELIKSGEL